MTSGVGIANRGMVTQSLAFVWLTFVANRVNFYHRFAQAGVSTETFGMEVQLSLFPDESRLTPTLIKSLVDPELPQVCGVVQTVFGNLVARRRDDGWFTRMDEGQCAWWLWTQIQHEAQESFSMSPSVRYVRQMQQSYLVVDDQVIVVYKKLRKVSTSRSASELLRSNFHTARNRDFWGQRQLEGCPDLPRVILGYELVAELTDVRCYLGLPMEGSSSLHWLTSIDPSVNSEWGDVITTSETPETTPSFEFMVEEEQTEFRSS